MGRSRFRANSPLYYKGDATKSVSRCSYSEPLQQVVCPAGKRNLVLGFTGYVEATGMTTGFSGRDPTDRMYKRGFGLSSGG